MTVASTARRFATLLACAALLAFVATGCNSKKDENLSDDEVWEEATGEPSVDEAEPPAIEAEPPAAEPEPAPPAGEGEGEAAPAGEGPSTEADGPAPTEVLADGSRLYGTRLDARKAKVALGALLADASRYDGEIVRTEGEIARVCQAMGCWMELREAADRDAIRVPMAGHSFFLPKDVAGRRAAVEGRVAVRTPSPDVQEHLRSEGALAAAQPVSLEATGVVVY